MSGHQRERNPSAALFERERELAVAEQSVRGLCGQSGSGDGKQSGLLLFSGEAGLGKTALLAEVRRIAGECGGCTVLFARGSESAETVPFHVVRQLLQPALAAMSTSARQELLGGWFDIAGPALGIAPPVGPQADPQGVRDGLDWLITQLSLQHNPLVVAIDDAHWSDPESLAWLTSFAVRLRELPLLVVLAYRPGELPEHTPAFQELVTGRAARAVELRALTPEAVAGLVRAALGPDADDPFCREVWAVTGGNPYEAVELIAKAQDRALKPVEESAALLRDLGAAARGSGLVNRLERLGSSVIRFAWAAAVLGTEIQPGLAANLAGMTPAEAGESADRLREARILVGSERLEFVHPLIATAVYKAIPAATRTAMHGQAAWLSEDAGLGVAVAARHLLEVHPDDDPLVVNQLRAAAREHLAVGAPDAARRCLERALREPPPEEDRAMLLYELGCAALLTSPQTTVNHLRAALALPDLSDDLRVDATYRLSQAYAHNNQLREAAEVVAAQAAATPPGPGLMRLQAARYLWKGIQVEEEDAHGRSRRIAELARHLKGRDNAERALLALRGFDGMIRGENALEVIEAVDRALVDGRLAEGLGWTNTEWGFEVPSIIGITYAYTDRLDEAGKLFDEGVRAFEISGWSGAHLAFAHDFRGLVYRRRGQLTEAEASLRKGLQLAHRLGPGLPIQWDGTCMLIDTLIARGRVEDAQVVAEENSFYPPYSPAIVLPDAACLAGRLLLARGKVKEAVAELESAGHRLQERGRNNTLWAPWALDLAAAIADEEPERARALAGQALRHALRFGTDTAIGEALRRSAPLAEPAEGLAKLEKAVEHLRRSPCRFEYAVALVDHGTALKRAGRREEAAARLRAGLALAERCGADGLVATARAEGADCGIEEAPPTG
ncbi:tetratricopeptide (TPR) repeat protein [Streptomyces olivoverticillatus]|uniref:Tetratricopeptide (TPR) repeat protein n=1 Tax=Streptomyces olivoverticillatus TaxID=66427 RepID=A0A7W7LPV3_9ACTN|nr:AAA family ATPase [Streptomyces olivoverticillatus]MBB4893767.1 tetratricopeptide (TPR) repeat protein [Streptomyces olivoverticillatus]